MKSNIKFIFKYVFGYSLFLLIIFLFSSCDVKAEVNNLINYKFINATPTSSSMKIDSWSAGEAYTYYGQSFTFDGAGTKFVKVSYCASGPIAITNISNTEGVVFYMGSYAGGLCNFYNSEYKGNTYQYYFAIKELVSETPGNYSVLFNLSMKSNLSYSTSFYLLDVSPADVIPQDITIPDYTVQLNDMSYRIGEVETTQQEIITKQNEIMQEQQKTNETLTDDNVDNSTNSANNFFSGFETDTFGLTSIITAPLNLISSITSSSCSPLPLDIPFLSKNNKLNLPCFKSIYEKHFGSFLTIYQTITFGLVAYWVCVKIFNLVKDFKNPDHDEIEVIDL